MKLSMIICMYNIGTNMLRECLLSCLACKREDFEIIIVDDGSSKDYSDLLAEFGSVKYYKTQRQGTLKARIFGAKHTTGDYVCYVDSDDTVSPIYHIASLKRAEDTNADIVLNDWAFRTLKSTFICSHDETLATDIVATGSEIMERFMRQRGLQHAYYVLWNKLFRREILLASVEEIERLNLDKMSFAEDMLISFFAFTKARVLVNTHVGHYYYRIHDGQQTAMQSKNKYITQITNQATVFDAMKNKLLELGLFEKYEKDFTAWRQLLACTHYAKVLGSSYKSLVPLIREKYDGCKLKKNFKGASKYYDYHIVFPLNYVEIDRAIFYIYSAEKSVKINKKMGRYAKRELCGLEKCFEKKYEIVHTGETYAFPKEKYKKTQLLVHSHFLYKVGTVLFPQGSKIRKILKSRL